MSAGQITPEEISYYRGQLETYSYLDSVQSRRVLDALTASRAEVQRLTGLDRDFRSLVTSVVRDEARRSDAGRVEVPELTKEEELAIVREFALKEEWPDDGVSEDFMDYVRWGLTIGMRYLFSRLSPSPQPATGASEEWVPALREAFADNGEHSHWNLLDPKTGELLWTEAPEEEWHKHHRRRKPPTPPDTNAPD